MSHHDEGGIQEYTQEDDFEWLANIFVKQGAASHPSGLHGEVLGELAGGVKRTDSDWLNHAKASMGIDEFNLNVQSNVEAELAEYYKRMADDIEMDSSRFQLLLPGDDYPISERLQALSEWVQGFLNGLALAAPDQLKNIDEDLQEMLEDLVEIAQVDMRMTDSEEAERAFIEVVEYVRIGVLNFYSQFNGGYEPDESSSRTLH